jgi:hypothetical protein
MEAPAIAETEVGFPDMVMVVLGKSEVVVV